MADIMESSEGVVRPQARRMTTADICRGVGEEFLERLRKSVDDGPPPRLEAGSSRRGGGSQVISDVSASPVVVSRPCYGRKSSGGARGKRHFPVDEKAPSSVFDSASLPLRDSALPARHSADQASNYNAGGVLPPPFRGVARHSTVENRSGGSLIIRVDDHDEQQASDECERDQACAAAGSRHYLNVDGRDDERLPQRYAEGGGASGGAVASSMSARVPRNPSFPRNSEIPPFVSAFRTKAETSHGSAKDDAPPAIDNGGGRRLHFHDGSSMRITDRRPSPSNWEHGGASEAFVRRQTTRRAGSTPHDGESSDQLVVLSGQLRQAQSQNDRLVQELRHLKARNHKLKEEAQSAAYREEELRHQLQQEQCQHIAVLEAHLRGSVQGAEPEESKDFILELQQAKGENMRLAREIESAASRETKLRDQLKRESEKVAELATCLQHVMSVPETENKRPRKELHVQRQNLLQRQETEQAISWNQGLCNDELQLQQRQLDELQPGFRSKSSTMVLVQADNERLRKELQDLRGEHYRLVREAETAEHREIELRDQCQQQMREIAGLEARFRDYKDIVEAEKKELEQSQASAEEVVLQLRAQLEWIKQTSQDGRVAALYREAQTKWQQRKAELTEQLDDTRYELEQSRARWLEKVTELETRCAHAEKMAKQKISRNFGALETSAGISIGVQKGKCAHDLSRQFAAGSTPQFAQVRDSSTMTEEFPDVEELQSDTGFVKRSDGQASFEIFNLKSLNSELQCAVAIYVSELPGLCDELSDLQQWISCPSTLLMAGQGREKAAMSADPDGCASIFSSANAPPATFAEQPDVSGCLDLSSDDAAVVQTMADLLVQRQHSRASSFEAGPMSSLPAHYNCTAEQGDMALIPHETPGVDSAPGVHHPNIQASPRALICAASESEKMKNNAASGAQFAQPCESQAPEALRREVLSVEGSMKFSSADAAGQHACVEGRAPEQDARPRLSELPGLQVLAAAAEYQLRAIACHRSRHRELSEERSKANNLATRLKTHVKELKLAIQNSWHEWRAITLSQNTFLRHAQQPSQAAGAATAASNSKLSRNSHAVEELASLMEKHAELQAIRKEEAKEHASALDSLRRRLKDSEQSAQAAAADAARLQSRVEQLEIALEQSASQAQGDGSLSSAVGLAQAIAKQTVAGLKRRKAELAAQLQAALRERDAAADAQNITMEEAEQAAHAAALAESRLLRLLEDLQTSMPETALTELESYQPNNRAAVRERRGRHKDSTQAQAGLREVLSSQLEYSHMSAETAVEDPRRLQASALELERVSEGCDAPNQAHVLSLQQKLAESERRMNAVVKRLEENGANTTQIEKQLHEEINLAANLVENRDKVASALQAAVLECTTTPQCADKLFSAQELVHKHKERIQLQPSNGGLRKQLADAHQSSKAPTADAARLRSSVRLEQIAEQLPSQGQTQEQSQNLAAAVSLAQEIANQTVASLRGTKDKLEAELQAVVLERDAAVEEQKRTMKEAEMASRAASLASNYLKKHLQNFQESMRAAVSVLEPVWDDGRTSVSDLTGLQTQAAELQVARQTLKKKLAEAQTFIDRLANLWENKYAIMVAMLERTADVEQQKINLRNANRASQAGQESDRALHVKERQAVDKELEHQESPALCGAEGMHTTRQKGENQRAEATARIAELEGDSEICTTQCQALMQSLQNKVSVTESHLRRISKQRAEQLSQTKHLETALREVISLNGNLRAKRAELEAALQARLNRQEAARVARRHLADSQQATEGAAADMFQLLVRASEFEEASRRCTEQCQSGIRSLQRKLENAVKKQTKEFAKLSAEQEAWTKQLSRDLREAINQALNLTAKQAELETILQGVSHDAAPAKQKGAMAEAMHQSQKAAKDAEDFLGARVYEPASPQDASDIIEADQTNQSRESRDAGDQAVLGSCHGNAAKSTIQNARPSTAVKFRNWSAIHQDNNNRLVCRPFDAGPSGNFERNSDRRWNITISSRKHSEEGSFPKASDRKRKEPLSLPFPSHVACPSKRPRSANGGIGGRTAGGFYSLNASKP